MHYTCGRSHAHTHTHTQHAQHKSRGGDSSDSSDDEPEPQPQAKDGKKAKKEGTAAKAPPETHAQEAEDEGGDDADPFDDPFFNDGGGQAELVGSMFALILLSLLLYAGRAYILSTCILSTCILILFSELGLFKGLGTTADTVCKKQPIC
jgi:predicted cobalt transporter CbtA